MNASQSILKISMDASQSILKISMDAAHKVACHAKIFNAKKIFYL